MRQFRTAHIKVKELFEEPWEPFGHLRLFLTSWIHFGSPERSIWISGEPKWLPKGPPLNTEVCLPPESHFGSSSFMCEVLIYLVNAMTNPDCSIKGYLYIRQATWHSHCRSFKFVTCCLSLLIFHTVMKCKQIVKYSWLTGTWIHSPCLMACLLINDSAFSCCWLFLLSRWCKVVW